MGFPISRNPLTNENQRKSRIYFDILMASRLPPYSRAKLPNHPCLLNHLYLMDTNCLVSYSASWWLYFEPIYTPGYLCFSIRSISFSLKQNAFLHKTLSSSPHFFPRRTPASTSRKRLVRSMHSRQMLLDHARRVWRLGVGEHCQFISSASLSRTISLTLYTYAFIVGPCQCDFGHYPCRWLENYNDMQPD